MQGVDTHTNGLSLSPLLLSNEGKIKANRELADDDRSVIQKDSVRRSINTEYPLTSLDKSGANTGMSGTRTTSAAKTPLKSCFLTCKQRNISELGNGTCMKNPILAEGSRSRSIFGNSIRW